MKPVTALILLFLSVTSPSLRAEVFRIDQAHSSVGFKIRHLVGRVPGHFGKFSGTIDLNEKNPSQSKVKAEIMADSIDTNQEKRDNHLRSEDFFWSEKYPLITFVSTRVTDSANTPVARVEGLLTLRGVSKPVVLLVEKLGREDSMGKPRAGFEATTTIQRKDFGIHWNKTLDKGGVMLGDDVVITLQIEAVGGPQGR